jgi:hypothetical protein
MSPLPDQRPPCPSEWFPTLPPQGRWALSNATNKHTTSVSHMAGVWPLLPPPKVAWVRGGLPDGLVACLRRLANRTTQIAKPDMLPFILGTAPWPRGIAVWVGPVAPEWFTIHVGRVTHGQRIDCTWQLRKLNGIVFHMRDTHGTEASRVQNKCERLIADSKDKATLEGTMLRKPECNHISGNEPRLRHACVRPAHANTANNKRRSITQSVAAIMCPSRISLEECGHHSRRTRPGCGTPCSSTSC